MIEDTHNMHVYQSVENPSTSGADVLVSYMCYHHTKRG